MASPAEGSAGPVPWAGPGGAVIRGAGRSPRPERRPARPALSIRSFPDGYHVKEGGHLRQLLVLGPARCAAGEVCPHPGFLMPAKAAEDVDPEQHGDVPAPRALLPHLIRHPAATAHEPDGRPGQPVPADAGATTYPGGQAGCHVAIIRPA